jgi:hypothetical protein
MMQKLLLIISLCVSSFVLANESSGSIAAKEWLNIIDAGEYAESWQGAAPFFKSQLSLKKWDDALQGIRTPLGKVTSRSELNAKEYSSLPGVPNGHYLVIQFKTEFQNKKTFTETLTMSKNNGQWLPVGYFIK